MSSRPYDRLAIATVLLAVAGTASAQSRLTLAATRRDTIALGAGGTVTAVFSVHNLSEDSVRATPSLILPPGWTALFGLAVVSVAPRTTDTWLLGVAAPAAANAGAYVIRASLRDSTALVSDSVVIRIAEHRAIELSQQDAPSFVGGGDVYKARFLLRNRGNVSATVRLRFTSSVGSRGDLDATTVTVAPGGSAPVVAQLTARLDGARSVEDIVELTAADLTDQAVTSTSSFNVLVVPRTVTHADNMATVPSELAVRASSPDAGVSTVVFSGAGPLSPGSSTAVDFAFRSPTGVQSIFGERSEYRVDFTTDKYRVRLGDGSHAFSHLTSSGFPGFGAEVRRDGDLWSTGGYVTRDRWSPAGGSEASWFAGTSATTIRPLSGSVVLVGRSSGSQLASVIGGARFGPLSTLELEAAASDSGGVLAGAQRGQLVGQFTHAGYDVGFIRSGVAFAGPSHGYENAHAALTAHPTGPLSFAFNANTFGGTAPLSLLGIPQQTTTTTKTLEADYNDALALIYESTGQHHEGDMPLLAVGQQTVRARAHARIGFLDLRGNVARQTVTYGNGTREPYGSVGIEARVDLRRDESLSIYVDRADASVLSELSPGAMTAGTSAQLRLPFGVHLNMNGSTTLPAHNSAARLSQGDLTLSRPIVNGMELAFREHFATYTHGIEIPGTNAFYLELRAPFGVPTRRMRAEGRVDGRVVDAVTGRGLSNLLVHIGNESVISDAQGRVSVSGLSPGRYALSLETADRASAGVLVGDASVDVAVNSQQPATFSVALAQGARIRATVRLAAFATGAALTGADSLIDDGGLESATVALQGTRDTIYQTSSAEGKVDFGVVAPGAWKMRIVSADIPAYHALDVEQVQLVVQPGDRRDVAFRVVPKRRAVKLMGPEGATEVIRAAPQPLPQRDVAPPPISISLCATKREACRS